MCVCVLRWCRGEFIFFSVRETFSASEFHPKQYMYYGGVVVLCVCGVCVCVCVEIILMEIESIISKLSAENPSLACV